MSRAPLYDTIGTTYAATRRTEPRIAAMVWAALGDAQTVLNVGAGTGSYEPSDRHVTAVEPSAVMRAVVVFTCDTTDRIWRSRFWLTRDYLPEITAPVGLATALARAIGARMEPVPVPCDCTDGFFEAYWRRPEAYLDERVRRGISLWARVGPDAEQRAVRNLRDDLASGRWAERNRDLLDLDTAELGLRLLIA
jgi:hypothetical protein